VAEQQAGRIKRFEDDGEHVLSHDDKGQIFSTPRGQWRFGLQPRRCGNPSRNAWRPRRGRHADVCR
jgi:hypothetical protein